MTRPICFLSDFGVTDTYVGQVKAVIAGVAPAAPVIDITHAVEPFAIGHGAWLLETALGSLPPGAVVLAVVDPGVGTGRRGIALTRGARTFVGPDNGLLSAALPASVRTAIAMPGPVPAPAGVGARELTATHLLRPRVAATFHGRDIFGPVAAFLAAGGALETVGPEIAEIRALPAFAPDADGCATIIHVDRYGNLVTTIPGASFPEGGALLVAGRRVAHRARTFGDVEAGALFLHLDSSGFVAVAVNQGSAAEVLGVRRGDRVRLAAS
jgi:hypothetical protein